ncbi:MAG TPA: 5-oxoprolinase subunit PxpB [Candidatus Methylomirabilis sp.]|nr:5-oxoprolinase subunit PxpB [Candidatus Methylomirabilis sp.]
MASPRTAHFRFQAASDQSLLVYFDQGEGSSASASRAPKISKGIHDQIRRFVRLAEMEPISGVRNLHPGYSSVLVKFDAMRTTHEQLEEILAAHIKRMEKVSLPKPRAVEIPVCYGGEYGPDLNDVAELHGLTAERVVELHSGAEYIVYFLGFVPGFAYLGELPQELVTPRLAAPRKSVPAGSVGIAKDHTGVYPVSTPGGWRLLGRTPVSMFQPERKEMSRLAIGDRVRFVPISREKFARFETA